MVQTFARLFPPAPLNQSAESAIGFCGRLQRLHSTGLCSLGVVFDPHRPYLLSLSLQRTCEFREAAKGSNSKPSRVGQ